MALADLLYRCPLCGEDPMESQSDQVSCPRCSTRFEPAPPIGESRIRVIREGLVLDIQAVILNRRIERLGGARTRALQPDGSLRASATVEAQFVTAEAPLRYRRKLLGFIERLDDTVWGELKLRGNQLELHPPSAEPANGGRGRVGRPRGARLDQIHSWAIEDIDSLQTSSSSVQVSLGSLGVVLFRFPDASVRRWDDLIRRSLRRRWRELGRGEILEFQPRIRGQ